MSDRRQEKKIADRVNFEIGARVRALRNERNLSQGALSALIGDFGVAQSQSYLSELEKGLKRWNVDHLVAVAQALGVDARDLLPGRRGEAPTAEPAPGLAPQVELLRALPAQDLLTRTDVLEMARAIVRALEAPRG